MSKKTFKSHIIPYTLHGKNHKLFAILKNLIKINLKIIFYFKINNFIFIKYFKFDLNLISKIKIRLPQL